MRQPMAPCSAATLGLMPRQDCAVARDDDGALDGNAQAVELFVIFRDAVVDVDQRRGDVAIDGVGVIRRELLVSAGTKWDRP